MRGRGGRQDDLIYDCFLLVKRIKSAKHFRQRDENVYILLKIYETYQGQGARWSIE